MKSLQIIIYRIPQLRFFQISVFYFFLWISAYKHQKECKIIIIITIKTMKTIKINNDWDLGFCQLLLNTYTTTKIWFIFHPVGVLNWCIVWPPEVSIPKPVTQANPDIFIKIPQLTCYKCWQQKLICGIKLIGFFVINFGVYTSQC